MTDNEKLLWDAARAIAQEGRPGWDWSTADRWEHDLALDEARAAFKVFQKGREALSDTKLEAAARAIADYQGVRYNSSLVDIWDGMARVALRAALETE